MMPVAVTMMLPTLPTLPTLPLLPVVGLGPHGRGNRLVYLSNNRHTTERWHDQLLGPASLALLVLWVARSSWW
jgi:hypothetical protein